MVEDGLVGLQGWVGGGVGEGCTGICAGEMVCGVGAAVCF